MTPALDVLLIEDDRGYASLVEEMLRRAASPCRVLVTHAERLASAMELARHHETDVAVLDLLLPDVSGIATLREFRRLLPESPVVVLTALDDVELAREAIEEGAQDFLTKERTTGKDLLRSIRMALARQRQVEELRSAALTDSLTGLYNRRGFLQAAERELDRARRSESRPRGGGQAPALLLFLDVDGLKGINDRHGHSTGDRALVACARALSGSLRVSDIIGRLGGDEFAVLLLDAAADVASVHRRIQEALERERERAGLIQPLSMSLGAASASDLFLALDEADRKMYEAKRRPCQDRTMAP